MTVFGTTGDVLRVGRDAEFGVLVRLDGIVLVGSEQGLLSDIPYLDGVVRRSRNDVVLVRGHSDTANLHGMGIVEDKGRLSAPSLKDFDTVSQSSNDVSLVVRHVKIVALLDGIDGVLSNRGLGVPELNSPVHARREQHLGGD